MECSRKAHKRHKLPVVVVPTSNECIFQRDLASCYSPTISRNANIVERTEHARWVNGRERIPFYNDIGRTRPSVEPATDLPMVAVKLRDYFLSRKYFVDL